MDEIETRVLNFENEWIENLVDKLSYRLLRYHFRSA